MGPPTACAPPSFLKAATASSATPASAARVASPWLSDDGLKGDAAGGTATDTVSRVVDAASSALSACAGTPFAARVRSCGGAGEREREREREREGERSWLVASQSTTSLNAAEEGERERTSMRKLRIVTFRMRDRSRGRYKTPADSPRHDGTLTRGLRVRRDCLRFVHRSRAIFCRPASLRFATFASRRVRAESVVGAVLLTTCLVEAVVDTGTVDHGTSGRGRAAWTPMGSSTAPVVALLASLLRPSFCTVERDCGPQKPVDGSSW
jgi:hypothetical protein